MKTIYTTFLAALAVVLPGCGGGGSAVSAQQACAAVDKRQIGGAEQLASTMVESANGTPSYCKVAGRIAPKLNFEIRIPDNWNGKLYYSGGGGFNGSIVPLGTFPVDSLVALKSGYVAIASDSGHQADAANTEWAINDPHAAQLWGSESVPTVTAAAKEIIKAAFGRMPSKSYFEGCSNGGREGMMAMQRNPTLFDGVIVRAPAYNTVGFFGHWQSAINAQLASGASLANAKVATLSKAVRDTCDALDGIADGIVSNQSACDAAFDPSTLRCAGGADTGNHCLSDPQLTSLRTIMSPATFGNAQTAYRDAARSLTGNDDDPGAWPAYVTGNGNPRATGRFALMSGAVKGFIARDYSIDPLAYLPYDRDLNLLNNFATVADATSPDIRTYTARGGKVIFWHGGNDPAFAVHSTADYVQAATVALGGSTNAKNSMRFYVAPGVNHCFGGPGAGTTDLLAALDQWVVENQPPDTLRAIKLDVAGAAQFERPLCKYPQYARYIGPANDANAAKLASSYSCVNP